MKKAGVTHEQVVRFVQEVRPGHVHLLGMGYQRSTAKRLVGHLLTTFSELTLSLDSNRLRAVTGRARPMTQSEVVMHAAEATGLYGAVDHPALSITGEQLDYTEAIVVPSMWAGRSELERVAAEGIQRSADRLLFLQDPDTYLQNAVEGQPQWMCPLLSLALDCAWSRFVDARVHVAVRTAAIQTTFSDAQIAR